MAFTLVSFAAVTALVAFISWWKTRGTDETTADGYFLGGRSLTGIVIWGSLMMTNLSAEQLVGRNGQGYIAGSVAMERIFNVTEIVGNRFLAITIMCVLLGIIGGIYAIFGDLKAVAVSDSLNGVIFIVGAALLIPILAFIALGDGSIAEGIRIFATASPEHLNAIQPANAQPPTFPGR